MLAHSAVKLSPIYPPKASDVVLFTQESPQEIVFNKFNSSSHTPFVYMDVPEKVSVSENATSAVDYTIIEYYSNLLNCLSNISLQEVDFLFLLLLFLFYSSFFLSFFLI